MPITPELKPKILEALRSGKYEQGFGQLKSLDNKYCCLGVMAEVTGQLDADGSVNGFYKVPPYPFCGLKYSEMEQLFYRNDGLSEWKYNPQTFEQIADFIEENL